MKASTYTTLLTRRPTWTLLLWGLVLALTVVLNVRLSPVLDLQLFAPDSEQSDAEFLDTLNQTFLEGDKILVILEGSEAIPVATAADLIDRIETELRLTSGVKDVRGRLSAQMRKYWEETAAHRLLIFMESRRIEALAAQLSEAKIRRGVARLRHARNPDPLEILPILRAAAGPFGGASPVRFVEGLMANRDLRRYFVLVEPECKDNVQIDGEVALVKGLDDALHRVRASRSEVFQGAGLRLYALGRAQVHVETYQSWHEDITAGLLLSIVAVYLVFALFFRRPFAALIALLPIVVSIGAAVLLGAWAFGEIHLVTLAFCILIVGLGIDFVFHISCHYWLPMDGTESLSRSALLAFAIEKPFRGVLLGGLTTAVAFLALTASSYAMIRQTGIIVAAGICFLLISSFTLLPVVLHVWPRRSREPIQRSSMWTRLLRGLARLHATPRRRAMGWLAWAALALAAALGVSELHVERQPRELLVRGNVALAELEQLVDEVRVSFYPLVVVSPGATPSEALARDDRFFRQALAASRKAEIELVDSLSAYLPPARQQEAAAQAIERHASALDAADFRQRYAAALAAAQIPYDEYLHDGYPGKISRMLAVDREQVTLESLMAEGFADTVGRHLKKVGDTWYAATYLYPRRYAWSEGALAPFLRFWEDMEKHSEAPLFLLGKPLRIASHVEAIRSDTIRITLFAVLGVVVLLCSGFRSGLAACRALAPVAVAVWILAGFMGATGIGLHILTLAVLPILFGIGVDDSVHIVARFRRGESLDEIYGSAGPGLVMTTVTTGAAFASLLLAQNAGMREFGLCGAVGVLLCLATSLHLLPLLYTAPKDANAGTSPPRG